MFTEHEEIISDPQNEHVFGEIRGNKFEKKDRNFLKNLKQRNNILASGKPRIKDS